MDQRSSITGRWWGGIKVSPWKRPFGGDGRCDSARRISGRRQFLPWPWPRPCPKRVRPPTHPPPPHAVIVVVIVINGARRISGGQQFLPQPRPRPNHICPPTPPPPPYAVAVVVIVVSIKKKNDNKTINIGLRWVDRHGDILITYTAVVNGFGVSNFLLLYNRFEEYK